MVAKKYKLYSASGENDKPGPCAFFASSAGCRNGANCKFLHVLPNAAPAFKESSSSSVVSSESEGEVPPAPAPPPAPTAPDNQQSSNKKKKKKKRKKSDVSDDIFASPKKQNVIKADPETESNSKKQKVSHKKTPQSASKAQKTETVSATDTFASMADVPPSSNPSSQVKPMQAVASFRSLNLPVASFHIEGQAPATTPATTVKTETPASQSELPVPKHTPTGLKWQNAVLKTRKHVRYNGSVDFEKMKESDEEAGCGYATDWITAQKVGPWCAENPQAIAIDCEMCETRDPVSGAVDSKALCRLSVINADNPDEVLLDTLVKPAWPVVDYRTRINGI
jgi:RNA exonuclease 1